jgi:DNA-binding CsgD family transcriptional regulator
MAEESVGAGDLDAAISILGELSHEGPSEILRGDSYPIPNPGLRTLYALRFVELLHARGGAADGARAEAAFADLFAFYRRAGATWYIDRLTERARSWGIRVSEPSTKGETRGELTRREREVALLVARGLTNREIASQLTISVRTAESHVEQIRSKLGFRTRAQIASWTTERYGSGSS